MDQVNNKKNILIIDDDLTVRKLISYHLKNNGFQTFEGENPNDGFRLLKEQKIDLVLCDVTMEEMDGFTFCKKVREIEDYKLVPFVFVTAQATFEYKTKAVEAGGDDFISKPFDTNEMLLKVRSLIRRSEIFKTIGTKKNIEEAFTEKPAKVLLVDDDVSLAKLFQYNINKAGFDCNVGIGAKEGLEIAKTFQPDIIISDIMMPEIDGYEFRRQILNEPNLKSIPFIFLTSKGDEEDILEGYDLGITDYILKTAGPRVVVAKVSAIIKSLGKERQKAVRELHQAADSMRVKVVPDNAPKFEGFEIKHWHLPFEGIPGGDFIDYFPLNDDNFAIILGDVMGKKWGAWYFAFAYAGYVRSSVRFVIQSSKDFNPKDIMEHVNRAVYQDAKVSEVFATLTIIILNNKTKTVKYTGAGDLPIIHYNSETNEVNQIQSKGMLLGFSYEGLYEDTTIQLKENDSIFLITDGILESRNNSGEQYGKDRLLEFIKTIPKEADPLTAVKENFSAFTGSKFEDDISLITIKAK